MIKYILIPILVLSNLTVHGQLRNNTPLSSQYQINSEVSQFELPNLDNEALQQEFGKIEDVNIFAQIIPVNISSEDGEWTEVGDYMMWRIKIKSLTAYGLTLFFKEFQLPKDGELYFYDKNKENIIGAYSFMNNNVAQTFTSNNLMFDGEVIIEYNCLRKDDFQLPFQLQEVGHIFC